MAWHVFRGQYEWHDQSNTARLTYTKTSDGRTDTVAAWNLS